MREYWQNHVTVRLPRISDLVRGPWDFDGFSQLSFADKETAQQGFHNDDLGSAFTAAENFFIGQLHIVTTQQIEVVPMPAPLSRTTLLKRISVLRRRTGIAEDGFRREWKLHGDLVRGMPGVKGYRQSVVLDRERVKGQKCGYDDLPIDGIDEFWFATPASLEAAFSSPQGCGALAHAKTFVSEITAFLVDEYRIV